MLKNLKLSDLRLGKKLGNGVFGEVFESKIAGSDVIYATKKLEKSKYMKNPKAYRYLENEINILNSTNHENIIKLYNSELEDRKFKYLITEYCNGGDLDNILEHYMKEKNRPFSEEEVQYIMRQLVSGIKYLHSKGKNKWEILHRDLKLENILLHFDNEDDRVNKRILKAKIKIIDFGFARYLKDELATSVLGSPMFMDPKILLKLNKIYNTNDFAYDAKVDIYSLGIICYNLLTGHPIFDVQKMEDLVKKTEEGKFQISASLSYETISFLNYMIRYDPKKRLDINQLSMHSFITDDVKNFTKIDRKELKDNLERSHLVFNTKASYVDKFLNDIIKKLNNVQEGENGGKIDDDIVYEPVKDIEKLIWESLKIINGDAMYIEPKIIPFIPGVDKDILLEKN